MGVDRLFACRGGDGGIGLGVTQEIKRKEVLYLKFILVCIYKMCCKRLFIYLSIIFVDLHILGLLLMKTHTKTHV